MTAPRFTNLQDAERTVRLEIVKQPLYDTQYQLNPFKLPKKARKDLLESPPDVVFLNGGPLDFADGRTNMAVAGMLTWPKRFFACGVRLDFNLPLDKETVGDMAFRLQVGERNYITLPLMQFDQKVLNEANDRAWFATSWASLSEVEEGPVELEGYSSPKGSIYIPCIQNFRPVLLTGGAMLWDTEIRCQLDGLLMREIQ